MTQLTAPRRDAVNVERPGARPPSSRFRTDVEGMRALAVILVVAFHAGVPLVPGGFVGVDVFFVISGFLITRMLVTEHARSGRIDFAAFWARRARRLLPASALTLLVVSVAVRATADPVMQEQVGGDVMAAAAFVANWWFAARAMDYFATDVGHSPIQHYWSLSVEEQFYLVWPVLLGLVLLAAARAGRGPVRRARWAAVALVALGGTSLAWSEWLVRTEPIAAHFATPGRAWELAVGGSVALAVHAGRIPGRRTRAGLGLVGLLAVVASGLALTSATPFPGLAALAPVLGTAAMILAGSGEHGSWHAATLLGARPLVRIGQLSYSWYLWHWPFIVLGPRVLGELDAVRMALVVVASLAASVVTFRLVEDPIRRSPRLARRPGLSLLGGGLLVLAGWGAGHALVASAVAGSTAAPESTALPGSAAVPGTSSSVARAITPAPARAGKDLTRAHADGCQIGYPGVSSPECRYGTPGGAFTLVLFGDSHATQWFAAAEHAATALGAELVMLGKSACMPVDVPLWSGRLGRAYRECDQWQADARRRLSTLPTGSVVLLGGRHDLQVLGPDGRRLTAEEGRRAVEEGYVRTVRSLEALGLVVVPLRDTPLPSRGDPARCTVEHQADPSACDFPRPPDSAGPSWEQQVLSAASLDLPVLDLNDAICGQRSCPVVVDQVLRWRDDDHISNTFATQLGPRFAEQLASILGARRADRATE